MADNTGGWHYTYADVTGGNDTSASHWWGIGVLAAETWGLDAPAWVKNIQKTIGIPLMQDLTDGHFGYTNNTQSIWDDATNVTAADKGNQGGVGGGKGDHGGNHSGQGDSKGVERKAGEGSAAGSGGTHGGGAGTGGGGGKGTGGGSGH